jgi:hypothetical protein
MRRRALVHSLIAALAALACAGPALAPGKARVFGTLHLVPHEGAPHQSGGGGSYGSIRLRDAGLVDYSKPGFAVIYVAEDAKPGGSAEIEIRDTHVEPRLVPDALAIGEAGRITVVNASGAPHIVSYPAARLVKRLAAGERFEIAVPSAGEQGLFLLDVPDATATVFAAPGRFTVVSTSGEYELRDLEPGETVLRAWHPRFPPIAHPVELAPDTASRVDLQMGVGIGGEAASR